MTQQESTLDKADELRRAIADLDLPTKVRLVAGASTWTTGAEQRLGLRSLTVSDGPVGVRGSREDEREWSANFPSPSALASTWSEAAFQRVGRVLASEAVRKDVDVVLGPTINLHRTPYGGRHFECLSEDPLLTARLATAYVTGLQSNGIGACPKHFVANDSETERHTLNAVVDEQTLRELYLAPFEHVVREAHPWMIMSAYNSVNGEPMTQSSLLEDPLKSEWGFDGVVVSDWEAVYSTEEPASAGLDLAMPGPEKHWGPLLEAAVLDGRVPETALDEKILRLVGLASRVGKLDGVSPFAERPHPLPMEALDAEARSLATEGMVLLENSGMLPLSATSSVGSIAILGPGSLDGRPQGGGSATVFPPHVVSPYMGLTNAIGDQVEVRQATGVPLNSGLRPVRPFELDGDVQLVWLDDDERAVLTEHANAATILRAPDSIPVGATHVHMSLRFIAPEAGCWRLGYLGVGAFTLSLDGEVVLENTAERAPQDIIAALFDRPSAHVEHQFTEGETVEATLDFRWAPNILLFKTDLAVEAPTRSEQDEFERAVTVARESDIAVVVVGTTSMIESEGFDREDLRLPGRQDELVEAIAAVNPNTVVVVNAGAPVAMPWRTSVGAVLVSWFPGMQFGNALADVLLGRNEPGGRLPTSWPTDDGNVHITSTQPIDGNLSYDEGLHVGYRAYLKHNTQPAYWIGAGQGYTTFDEAVEEVHTHDDGAVAVKIRVTNTGERRGKHLIQAYLSKPESRVDRPMKWLAGFATVEAGPGETTSTEITIPRTAFRHWSTNDHAWAYESGSFELSVGRTLGEITHTETVLLHSRT